MNTRSIIFTIVVVTTCPISLINGGTAEAVATDTPLTIAFIGSQSGPAATEDEGDVAVFRAAIDIQNAHGGVNGHHLDPLVIDDQTSPSAVITGVQEAISRGAIGIVSVSALMDLAAKYPQQAGVPVTGDSSSGPSWGLHPNTNMFGIGSTGSVDPNYPVSELYAKLVERFGGTKMAVYALSVSPDSVQANSSQTQSLARVDGAAKTVIDDRSVPFSNGTDFGPAALIAKTHDVNIVFSNLIGSESIALATAYKQAGVKTKAFILQDGYAPSLIKTPAWANLQGDIFEVVFHPFYQPNLGTKRMQTALVRYAGWTRNQFPTYSEDQAWLGTELLIQGLERAGSNPSRRGVVESLRRITRFNGNGLLPFNINYATGFGHMNGPACVWLTRAGRHGFMPLGNRPICGSYISGTTSVVSSS